jgi:hypothetical protein
MDRVKLPLLSKLLTRCSRYLSTFHLKNVPKKKKTIWHWTKILNKHKAPLKYNIRLKYFLSFLKHFEEGCISGSLDPSPLYTPLLRATFIERRWKHAVVYLIIPSTIRARPKILYEGTLYRTGTTSASTT